MRARVASLVVLACAACAGGRPPAALPPAVAHGVAPVAVASASSPAASASVLPPLPPPCAAAAPSTTASGAPSPSSSAAPTASSSSPAVAAAPAHIPGEDEVLDDGAEPPAAPLTANGAATAASPLDAISDAELETKLGADPSALGTISLGSIHSGALLFGAAMPAGDNWQVVSPPQSFAAHETVAGLTVAIDAVAAQFPGTSKAFIGDISRQGGGHFPPHVSHQSGRDVDMSYYLLGDTHRWYVTANAKNLDLPRTWALVRAFITLTDVELLLMDRSVQRLVKDYAASIGEDAAWLDDIFQIDGKSRRPIIIHVPGHASHLHVRFFAAESRELGRRAYPILMKRHLIRPPTYFVDHVVHAGETLRAIAARERVSVDAIKRANHMASSAVVRGRTLKIPRSGGIERPASKVVAPPRRLPPEKVAATIPTANPCQADGGP